MLQSFTVPPARAPANPAPCAAGGGFRYPPSRQPLGHSVTGPASRCASLGTPVCSTQGVCPRGPAVEPPPAVSGITQAPLRYAHANATAPSLGKYKHKRYKKSRSWTKSPDRSTFTIRNEMNVAFGRPGTVHRPARYSAGSGTTSTGIRELLMTRLDTLPRKV